MITYHAAKQAREELERQEFEDLLTRIDQKIIESYDDHAPFTLKITVDLLYRGKFSQLCESSDWNLLGIYETSIQLQRRKRD